MGSVEDKTTVNIGDLQVVRKLGSGSYSTVYLTIVNGKNKALKISKATLEGYLMDGISDPIEIDIMSRFHHPHIMQIDDIIVHKKINGVGILMDYAPETLASFMKNGTDYITYLDISK